MLSMTELLSPTVASTAKNAITNEITNVEFFRLDAEDAARALETIQARLAQVSSNDNKDLSLIHI
jgi:hypothetical protein